MVHVFLTFERGGLLPVTLFDRESPHNALEIQAALPLQSTARHCSWSGQGFFWRVSGLEIRAERQRVAGIGPGALCIEHYPAGVREVGTWSALLLVYGDKFWFKNPFTPAWPLCVVGHVAGDLTELGVIGRRMYRQGREGVSMLPGPDHWER